MLKLLLVIVCGVVLGWFVINAIRGGGGRGRIDKRGRNGGTIIDGTGSSHYSDRDRGPDANDAPAGGSDAGGDAGGGGGDGGGGGGGD